MSLFRLDVLPARDATRILTVHRFAAADVAAATVSAASLVAACDGPPGRVGVLCQMVSLDEGVPCATIPAGASF